MDLKNVGKQYDREELVRETLKVNPFEQLEDWMQLALSAKIPYANAATVATLDKNGFPQARVILVKEIRDESLIFYTNYHSNKAQDIERHPQVSFNIYWKELDRQVRLTGIASRTSEKESREYFYSRPRESQISAVASNQSHIVTKEELYQAVKKLDEETKGKEVPFPDYWGGYQVKIDTVEFWQGRPNRLHDRFLYTRADEQWEIKRLAP